MAEEKVNVLQAAAEKQPKAWKYVGPGGEGREKEPVPLISNLPIDIKQPRLGFRQEKYPATELPVQYIEYVMKTNKEAKDWWK